MYNAAEASSSGRLQRAPEFLQVDEEGLIIAVDIYTGVDSYMNDGTCLLNSSVNGVKISDITVDNFPCVVPHLQPGRRGERTSFPEWHALASLPHPRL